MLEPEKNHSFKVSFLYSLIIITLMSIPAYFYTQIELDNYKYKETNALQEHASIIKRALYDFSNANTNIFNFPKSFHIEATIVDKNSEIIYSTKKYNVNYDDRLYINEKLNSNRLNAYELILSKEFSYKEIYLKTVLLIFFIGFFVFISAYFIIKASITPYKRANDFLDKFFNDAMHELRTPLGVMQFNLEILEEKDNNSKEIKRSLNGLKNLLFVYDDLEYFIKHKKIKFLKETIDFSSFLDSRIEIFQSIAFSKKIILRCELEKNIIINFNRAELQKIIDNTISNAIKYSKSKTTVSIFLYSIKDKYIFCVKDEGLGIKDLKKIFNRYYRENNIQGGFGLGLSIVKNICDKNSVKIQIKSELQKGSLFEYYFNK